MAAHAPASDAVEQRSIGPASFSEDASSRAPVGGAADWMRSGAALVGVIGLILGLAWVARRTAPRAGLSGQLGAGGRAPSGVLEVLGRFPVARGQTLVLLRLDTRVLLVSQTSSAGFRTLCEVTDAEEVASLLLKTRTEEEAGMADRFKGLLKGFQREHIEAAPEPMARTVAVGSDGDRAELLSPPEATPPALSSLLGRLRAPGARQ